MNINEYLQKNKNIEELKGGYQFRKCAPWVVCADGFTMSVQVSSTHYCTPRVDDSPYYCNAEIGFPNQREEMIMEWAEDADNPTDTVYGYVPVDVIDAVIVKHGGFKTAA